ncbi:MAG TPA: serine hydrolase domain-containing protein [Acidimicrobiales bacterium]|nr:serine hydrolase domain-containing protein [Acidimicrobiales bacterium]
MTTIDGTVVADPTELGLDPDRLAALIDRARREVDAGLLPSCQLAVARHGRLGAFVTLGEADNNSRYVVFSCTKALTAGMAWLLLGQGALTTSTRAAELVPEFGTNGKEVVTLEHLLTHTAGFPNAPLGPPEWNTAEGRLERFSRWRLEWEPGSRYVYHPTSAHWVVAHMIQAATGQDHRSFFTERIAGPLGLEAIRLGLPRSEQANVATLEIRGEPATPDELEAALGIRQLPVTEVTDEALVGFNDPAAREVGVPGGGAVTTAADLALYYQALLHNPGGLWDADVLADATGAVRVTMPDPLMGSPANRTLGLIIAGDDGKANLRGFGRTVSGRAFGHGGAAGQIAWADPETGLSFAYVTNGIDPHPIRLARRGVALSSLAGACAPPSAVESR